MANSILFWPTAAKGKKGTIVAMIAGTKAQAVSYYRKINNEIFWDNTWHGKHGIDCQKMFS
jgi:hypothetical protein